MLAETRTELDEFHASSKELEEELERVCRDGARMEMQRGHWRGQLI